MAAWARDHADYFRAVRGLARELKRPVFVGEFGLAAKAGRMNLPQIGAATAPPVKPFPPGFGLSYPTHTPVIN